MYISTPILRAMDIIELVFKLTENRGFISGGFARYAISQKSDPEMPGDIDIFTRDDAEFTAVRNSISMHALTRKRSESDMEVKFEYVFSEGYHTNCYKIQLIKPLRIDRMVTNGTISDVLDNFDFTIAKSAIESAFLVDSPYALCHPQFHEHDAESQLVLTNIHCPISSLKRVIKYTKRGFNIENTELLKLFKDYEGRSAEWKMLIDRGINMPSNLSPAERTRFARGMYMD